MKPIVKSVVVKEKPSGTQEKPLIIIVGKQVSNKSTDRNLIKRRIRSIFRELTKSSGNDYTVIVRPRAQKTDFKDLKEEIENQLN